MRLLKSLGKAASVITLLAALSCFSSRGDDWTQYRGPDHNGTSREKGWLDHWPAEGPKIAWKANVGLGFSDFVVRADRAYTMGHADGADNVFCFDTSNGKVVW